jgi:uncharacterized membrane protein YbaN (DUF454 family)
MTPTVSAPRLLRFVYAGLGVACFGLGAVGAVLPGLPTTVFLIVGSYFLARSCPALREALLATRLLRPYARFVTGGPMPRRAAVAAIGLMWTAIACSAAWFAWRGDATGAIVAALLVAGVAGTIAICVAAGAGAFLRREGR